eukprot:1343142-Amorphochlora_amoeboformis.AAC.1
MYDQDMNRPLGLDDFTDDHHVPSFWPKYLSPTAMVGIGRWMRVFWAIIPAVAVNDYVLPEHDPEREQATGRRVSVSDTYFLKVPNP